MDTIRIFPHDNTIEQTVLGAIINHSDCIYDVSDLINRDVFFNSDHRAIYDTMLQMMRKNRRIDIISLYNELKSGNKTNDLVNEVYLSELTDKSYSSIHVLQHCQILKEYQLRRSFIVMSKEIQERSYDLTFPIDETIDFTEKSVFNNTVEEIKSEPEQIGLITEKVTAEIEYKQQNPDKIGIPSGFNQLKWYNSDLIIAAARPSMGKTYVGAVKWGFEAAMYGVPVLIFSLEMSKQQITQRFLSLYTGINSNDLRAGRNIDWNELEKAQAYMNKLPVYIDDNAGLSIWQIQSKCRKMKIKHNIGLIIVDYIGLVTGATKSNQNRDQELGVISRTLKKIAKDLDVPVIALSQLNRGVEQRADKKPILSDLRESGNIEQDADQVMMFYREYYYTHNETDAGIGEIIVRKNRHGDLPEVKFYHSPDWSKIDSSEIRHDPNEYKIYDNSDIKENNIFNEMNEPDF
jgi:replicative DNA helicase